MEPSRRGFFKNILGAGAGIAICTAGKLTEASGVISAVDPDIDDAAFSADVAQLMAYRQTPEYREQLNHRMSACALPFATQPLNVYLRQPPPPEQPALDHLVADARIDRFDRIGRLVIAVFDAMSTALPPHKFERLHTISKGPNTSRIMSPRYCIDIDELTPAKLAYLILDLGSCLLLEMEAALAHARVTHPNLRLVKGFYTPGRMDFRRTGPLFEAMVYMETRFEME